MLTPQSVRWYSNLCQKSFAGLIVLCTTMIAHAAPNCPSHPIRFALYEYGVFFMPPDRGIDYELGLTLQQRSGCPFVFPVWSRAQIWRQLKAGTLDMTASALKTLDRAEYVHFVLVHNQKNFLVVRKDFAASITTPAELLADKKVLLGEVRGYRYSPGLTSLMDQLRQSNRLDIAPDQATLFKRLALRRIDGLFATPTSYVRYLSETGLTDAVRILDVLPNEKPLPSGLALAKQHFSDTQAQEWKKLIQQMQQDGTLQRIFRRYLPIIEADAMLKVDVE